MRDRRNNYFDISLERTFKGAGSFGAGFRNPDDLNPEVYTRGMFDIYNNLYINYFDMEGSLNIAGEYTLALRAGDADYSMGIERSVMNDRDYYELNFEYGGLGIELGTKDGERHAGLSYSRQLNLFGGGSIWNWGRWTGSSNITLPSRRANLQVRTGRDPYYRTSVQPSPLLRVQSSVVDQLLNSPDFRRIYFPGRSKSEIDLSYSRHTDRIFKVANSIGRGKKFPTVGVYLRELSKVLKLMNNRIIRQYLNNSRQFDLSNPYQSSLLFRLALNTGIGNREYSDPEEFIAIFSIAMEDDIRTVVIDRLKREGKFITTNDDIARPDILPRFMAYGRAIYEKVIDKGKLIRQLAKEEEIMAAKLFKEYPAVIDIGSNKYWYHLDEYLDEELSSRRKRWLDNQPAERPQQIGSHSIRFTQDQLNYYSFLFRKKIYPALAAEHLAKEMLQFNINEEDYEAFIQLKTLFSLDKDLKLRKNFPELLNFSGPIYEAGFDNFLLRLANQRNITVEDLRALEKRNAVKYYTAGNGSYTLEKMYREIIVDEVTAFWAKEFLREDVFGKDKIKNRLKTVCALVRYVKKLPPPDIENLFFIAKRDKITEQLYREIHEDDMRELLQKKEPNWYYLQQPSALVKYWYYHNKDTLKPLAKILEVDGDAAFDSLLELEFEKGSTARDTFSTVNIPSLQTLSQLRELVKILIAEKGKGISSKDIFISQSKATNSIKIIKRHPHIFAEVLEGEYLKILVGQFIGVKRVRHELEEVLNKKKDLVMRLADETAKEFAQKQLIAPADFNILLYALSRDDIAIEKKSGYFRILHNLTIEESNTFRRFIYLYSIQSAIGHFSEDEKKALETALGDGLLKKIASLSLGIENPPDIFNKNQNPNQEFNVRLYSPLEPELIDDMFMQEDYSKEDREGIIVYRKLLNGKRVTVYCDPSGDLDNYKGAIFKDMDNPNIHMIVYNGHTGMGAALAFALRQAPKGDALQFGNKIIAILSCESVKNYLGRIMQRYPYSHFIGSTNVSSSYYDTDTLGAIINGITQEVSWESIKKMVDAETDQNFKYRPKDYKLKKTEYLFPHQKEKMKYVDLDGDGLADETKEDMFYIPVSDIIFLSDNDTFNIESGNVDISRIRTDKAFQTVSRIKYFFQFNDYLKDIAEKIQASGFRRAYRDEHDASFAAERQTENGKIYNISVNVGYRNSSEAALSMMMLYELNTYFSKVKKGEITIFDKARGLQLAAEFVKYYHKEDLFPAFLEKYGHSNIQLDILLKTLETYGKAQRVKNLRKILKILGQKEKVGEDTLKSEGLLFNLQEQDETPSLMQNPQSGDTSILQSEERNLTISQTLSFLKDLKISSMESSASAKPQIAPKSVHESVLQSI